MAKNFIHEGDVLNYTAGANIASGQFVLIGAIGGVAIGAIANGATGAVRVKGVFSVPKASGAVTQGAKLYWDATNSVLTTTAPGIRLSAWRRQRRKVATQRCKSS